MNDLEPIVLHTDIDPETGARTVSLVGAWPRSVLIDDQMLTQADPTLLSRDGDMVTITLANGRAVYAVTRDDVQMAWHGRLVSSRLMEVG